MATVYVFGLTNVPKRTPCAAGLKPAGRYVAKDRCKGTHVALTVRISAGYGVVCPVNERQLGNAGRICGTANVSFCGATVKVVDIEQLKFSGGACCFDRLGTEKKNTYEVGEVLVVRYGRPKGDRGGRVALSTAATLRGKGMDGDVAGLVAPTAISLAGAEGTSGVDAPGARLDTIGSARTLKRTEFTSGHARQAEPEPHGAAARLGGAAEKARHADI